MKVQLNTRVPKPLRDRLTRYLEIKGRIFPGALQDLVAELLDEGLREREKRAGLPVGGVVPMNKTKRRM